MRVFPKLCSMKGKRTVTEDRAKIIEAKLNDPLVSNKDIGEKL